MKENSCRALWRRKRAGATPGKIGRPLLPWKRGRGAGIDRGQRAGAGAVATTRLERNLVSGARAGLSLLVPRRRDLRPLRRHRWRVGGGGGPARSARVAGPGRGSFRRGGSSGGAAGLVFSPRRWPGGRGGLG